MKIYRILLIITFLLFGSLFAREITRSTVPSEIYKGCAKCHGKDGRNIAYGRSDEIAGQDVEDLVESINFFKDSQFGSRGIIHVMANQVKHLNDEQIEALAKYISNLGKKKDD
jgi:cytochrome c553